MINKEEYDKFLKREKRIDVRLIKFLNTNVRNHVLNYSIIYSSFLLIVFSANLLLFEKTRDFGLNLTTEMIGLFITVVFIDKLYRNKEKRRTYHIDKMIQFELQKFIDGYMSVWKGIKINFFNHEEINEMKVLIAKYKNILDNTKINEKFVLVEVTNFDLTFINKDVREAFLMTEEYIKDFISKFLIEYKVNVDPSLYSLLKKILADNYVTSDLRNLKDIQQTKFLRHVFAKKNYNEEEMAKLSFYFNIHSTDHLRKINDLINYADKQYLELKKLGLREDNRYKFATAFAIRDDRR